MEILFIGIIIVALMAYVSTRIKKNAAAAFAVEEIETDEFAMTKPEGFLSPVQNEEFLAFYAFSKEFGEDEGAEKIRQGEIKLRKLAGRPLSEIARERLSGFDSVVSDSKDESEAITLVGEKSQGDAKLINHHMLVARGDEVFDLEIAILSDYEEKFAGIPERLFESFRIK
jgi:hypothetical protein